MHCSPLELSWDVFVDESLVIGLYLLHLRQIVCFGVQVVFAVDRSMSIRHFDTDTLHLIVDTPAINMV